MNKTVDMPRPGSARPLRMGLLIAAIIGLATSVFAWYQVQAERDIDIEDVTRRAHALAQQRTDRVLAALAEDETEARAELQSLMGGYRRLLGYAVFREDGRLIVSGKALTELVERLELSARNALLGNEVVEVARAAGMLIHVLAQPVPEAGPARGVLVVVHDVSYLDERAAARFTQYAFGILTITLLVVALIVGATWFAYERPLSNLADWMRRLRVDNAVDAPPSGLSWSTLHTESNRLAASFRAARSTGRELSEAATHSEQVWTASRLRAHALTALGEAHQLIVVSNREPYMHQWRDGKSTMIMPAGGLVTALDPVLQACGGVWIAHGAGDADSASADMAGRLTVPPGDARYTLRRVWLTREEEQGYYYGLANEGLWPLCHLAYERPVFRREDWAHYQAINRRFADAVLEEVGSGQAVVLVQDYQMSLVPRMLKEVRPDLRVGLFWHIPWPNSETFRICPWGAEILDGMLGADLIGFHLRQYCNNFLDTVDRVLESRLDWDHFTVELRGAQSMVRPFPISVQPWSERHVAEGEALERRIGELREQYQIGDRDVVVGVDRVDYTKGLPERFRAIARALEKYPRLRGRFTHVALGAPSRTHIPRYRAHLDKLEALADEINWTYQSDGWKPIHFLVAHHDPKTVHAFMSMASVCLVSSLHDGMNLVAKEYVAARQEKAGVLVLSEFAGAARELGDALVINPYDTEQFADAICYALEMNEDERRNRMKRMVQQVEEHNIYRWAARFLAGVAEASSAARGAFQGRQPDDPDGRS